MDVESTLEGSFINDELWCHNPLINFHPNKPIKRELFNSFMLMKLKAVIDLSKSVLGIIKKKKFILQIFNW